MEHTMERWHSATGQRFAVRKYAGAPTEEELEHLYEIAEELCAHGARIEIAHNKKAFSPVLMGLGSVRGTDCYAAFISRGADLRTIGYIGEAFVLECTAMGLGTCWLGIFNKRAVANAIELLDDERVVCITPIGVPNEKYAGRPRKGLDRLTDLNQEQLQSLPEWQRYALECARIAPSATNAQPWKFKIDDEAIFVSNTGSNFGFGLVDCGIAMLHMELGAAHGGVAGDWTIDGADAMFSPADLEDYDDLPFDGDEYAADLAEEYEDDDELDDGAFD